MKEYVIKEYIIKAIKYGPVVLAISGASKILIFNFIDITTPILIANTINIILNILCLWFISVLNVYFKYCNKIKTLCKLTKYGYWFYAISLYSGFISSIYCIVISTIYCVFIVCYCLHLKYNKNDCGKFI